MNVENSAELRRRIEALKREKNAIILAHYYTKPEVQAVADFLGDSLALSVRAQQVEARIILFAGVHFMAETAKVLCPDKKVLIPCPEAGCSLAESCDAKEFAAFKAKYAKSAIYATANGEEVLGTCTPLVAAGQKLLARIGGKALTTISTERE